MLGVRGWRSEARNGIFKCVFCGLFGFLLIFHRYFFILSNLNNINHTFIFTRQE